MKPKRPAQPMQAGRTMPVTHHEAPPEEMHRGTLFVVRDEDWEIVWGANMTYAEAQKCKERVAGRRMSRIVMFEPMPTDTDLLALCLDAQEFGRKLKPTPELEEARRRLNGEPPPEVKAEVERKRREIEERRRAAQAAERRRAAEAAAAAAQDEDEDEDDGVEGNGADPLAAELEDASLDEILEQ